MKIAMTTEQTTNLTKVCAQLGITIETGIARHSTLEYGPLMARLIDARNAASFEAKKNDTVSTNQRISLKAHRALATHLGNAALVTSINKILADFDATYAKASQALDICFDTQGKPASQFFPKRESSNGSAVTPAASIDVTSIVMPEEAV
jgi:hypothetical protein